MAEGDQPKKKKRKPRAKAEAGSGADAKAEAEVSTPTDEGKPQKRRGEGTAGRKGAAKAKAVAGAEPPGAKPKAGADESRGWGRWFWLGLLVVGAVELFIYGYRGDLEVCVGRSGVTDFALKGQPRSEDNRGKHPECHRARNIGLRGGYDEAVQESAIMACKRATLFQGQDVLLQCAAGLEPFEHRVEARFVWPWEPDYYRRLFWFLFSSD